MAILILVVVFILLVVIVCCREEPEKEVPIGRVRLSTVDERHYIVAIEGKVQVVKAKRYRGEVWNCSKDNVNKGYILSAHGATLGHELHNLILTCKPEPMAVVKFIKPYRKKDLYNIQVNDRYVTIIDDRVYITSDKKQAGLFRLTAA
jgi:hypothetical protein